MEFSIEHAGRRDQLTALQGTLAARYAELKIQYENLHQEMISHKTKAHYWEAQFNKFKSREELLQAEIDELKAQLRKREQQLFGKKS